MSERSPKRDMYATEEYLQKNPTWHAEDSSWKAAHILRMMEKNGIWPASVCEVGCGAGEILNQLHSGMPGNARFVGYEISPYAYSLSKGKEQERLEFRLADFLGEEEAIYDVVLAIDVIEHVEDYIGFLRKLRQKGQYKIFHIPLDISVQAVLRRSKLVHLREQVGHIHYFTRDTAMATLKDAGYEIIDSFYTAAAIDLPARSLKSLIARVPRKILYALSKDMAARMLGGFSLMVLAR